MTRSTFVFPFVFAAVAACATLTAPQASARALGGFSLNTTGTRTPSQPSGVYLCTAHLHLLKDGRWLNHTASGFDTNSCLADASGWMAAGYENESNEFPLCHCYPGFNGFMVASPSGNGPLGVQDLTLEQVQRYDEGLAKLREKYQLDRFAEEHEMLLEAIEAMSAEPAGN